MLIHSASQLLTLSGGPQRGDDLGRLEVIQDGAVLIQDGKIAALGRSRDLRNAFPGEPETDAGGKVVMPGFVDPHTHAIWVGDRAAEFELRLQGKTYLEILAAGGGIISTVHATRTSSLEKLKDETRPRLWSMFTHGTTTAEVKSGYGLRTAAELRMLQALLALNAEGPIEIAPTFLGAHAIAPEYRDRADDYTSLICCTMIPILKEWWPAQVPFQQLPFVDVFCETGAFSLEQSARILSTAKELGFPLKIHADEFDNLGGARLAAELKATSADHLVKTSSADIQALARQRNGGGLAALHPFRPGRTALHACEGNPQRRRAAGNRYRPESRHGMVREHAVCDCPGMPLSQADSRTGDRCGDDQCRCRDWPRQRDRID